MTDDQSSTTSEHPTKGQVVAVHIASIAPDVTPQASQNANVTYDITLYGKNGTQQYKNVTPAQARYDCWFYPAPVNAIADVTWVGDKPFFTVLELPVTEDC